MKQIKKLVKLVKEQALVVEQNMIDEIGEPLVKALKDIISVIGVIAFCAFIITSLAALDF